jgi:para-nitrobenzyl esterase
MHRIAYAALVALLAGSPAVAAETPSVPLTIPQGALSGVLEDGIATFKNIPFAAPPIGTLRWRAPQPAASWSGVRPADRFGPACPQKKASLLRRLVMPSMEQDEDCLSLNVWTPRTEAAAKLPVMVFIYGGSFTTGSAAFPLYDGTDLARHGVIVVTLNYRLGILGFFDHPALAAENPNEAAGNYGLMDQIAALEWVQQNIAAFGGDPGNVTIFGESAGGMSVNDLMISPRARELFTKAIAESGLGFNTPPTAEKAQDAAQSFAEYNGARGDGAAVLAKLRNLSVSEIINEQAKLPKFDSIGPFIDGKLLPEAVGVAFAQGHVAKVPYISGSNSNEATLMEEFHMSPTDVLKPLAGQLSELHKAYDQNGALSDNELGRQLYNDSWFAAPAQSLASFVSNAGAPAYVYQFAYLTDAQRKDGSPGVGHGYELGYVFGLRGLLNDPFYAGYVKDVTPADRDVVARTQTYWTNFAKTGDPNGAGLPQWSSTSSAAPRTLVVDNDGTKTVDGFRKAQLALISAAWTMRNGLSGPAATPQSSAKTSALR